MPEDSKSAVKSVISVCNSAKAKTAFYIIRNEEKNRTGNFVIFVKF